MDQQFDVAPHVQVAGREVGELHRALLPAGFHLPQRHPRPDDKILYVAGVNAGADLQESRLPAFALPAVRRIGIDGKGFVSVTDVHERVEVVGAHRGRAGVNLVA